jgi:hypothetical protein
MGLDCETDLYDCGMPVEMSIYELIYTVSAKGPWVWNG